jgi:1,4-dihydroxy-2-naphthoate octaprenyltransferase
MRDHFLMIISTLTGIIGITVKYKPILDFTFVLLGVIGLLFSIYYTWQKIKQQRKTIGGK